MHNMCYYYYRDSHSKLSQLRVVQLLLSLVFINKMSGPFNKGLIVPLLPPDPLSSSTAASKDFAFWSVKAVTKLLGISKY